MGSIWRPHTNTHAVAHTNTDAHARYTDTALIPPHTHNYTHILYAHPFTQTLDSPFSSRHMPAGAHSLTQKLKSKQITLFCALTSMHTRVHAPAHTHTLRAPTRHGVWVISAGGWPNRRLYASEPPRRPPSWEAAHRGNEGEWLTSLFLFFFPQLCLQTALWCGKLKRTSVSISPYVQPHSSISSPSSPALHLCLLFFSTVDPRK